MNAVAKVESFRESAFFEHDFDFQLEDVRPEKQRWFWLPDVDDARRHIKALRLDALVGPENADGEEVARGFAEILLGLRADVVVGVKLQSGEQKGWTFTRGILRGLPTEVRVEESPPDRLPHLQHAVLGPLPRDIVVPPRQNSGVALTYTGPQVVCRRLRVAVLGMNVRVREAGE